MAYSSSLDAVKESGQTQKWVLRVPVDCEGCRKKVTKIVHNVTGVESCEVDIKQQKVVVTGNVDVGTLLKTLVKKTGKHAELWPEEKTRKKKGKGKVVRGEAEDARSSSHENSGEDQQRASNCEEDPKKVNGKSESAQGDGDRRSKKAVQGLDAPPSAEVDMENKVGEGNKMKSKGRNGKEKIRIRVESPPVDDNPPALLNNVPPRHRNFPTSAEVNGQPSSPQAAPLPNHIPPRHPIPSTSPPVDGTTASYGPSHFQPHPQPQPVYTVSYSAVSQPLTSRAAVQNPRISDPPSHPGLRLSYYYPQPQQPVYTTNYTAAPKPQTSAYGYQYQGISSPYDPRVHRSYDDDVDYDAYGYRQQQPESFGMFSDENPNACLIM